MTVEAVDLPDETGEDVVSKRYPAPMSGSPPIGDPPNPESKLWRYMDFTKFVSLLSSGALHFSRSDLLAPAIHGAP